MAKFLLHRIQRMSENPAAEKITPGLEAAAYLHWTSCYEHEPEKFIVVEPQLPELHQQVAEYFELTARETAAHLELMAATASESGRAVSGTGDFQTALATSAPGRVEMIKAQFGFDWVLLYWDAPRAGGKPWGYRVYRTDKQGAPVLVATVTEPEALLAEQPERVKLYYHVKAFSAAGETPPSAEFGVMLNAPEDEPEEPSPAAQSSVPAYPEHEMPIRRELGAALMTFIQKLTATRLEGDDEDTVMRQVATEEFRQVVEKAARQNVEVSLVWQTLGLWTEDGKERIGYFARALECCRAEAKAKPPETFRDKWVSIHMQAECLFEIGRVHFHEDAPAAARKFLGEALPLAREADALQSPAGVTDDRLEGRITELLLQLPEEE